MSALRAAQPEVFELHRSSSFRQPGSMKHRHASEEDDGSGDNTDASQDQADFEEGEEEVDESVREDMKKLEDTFPGISDRFRLVNRIGEGMVAFCQSKRPGD